MCFGVGHCHSPSLLQEREVHFALGFSLTRFSAAAMREDVLVDVSFPQC